MSLPILKNSTHNPARIMSFLGGPRRGGFTINPGDSHTLTQEQVDLIKSDKSGNQMRIIRANIEAGKLQDLRAAFDSDTTESIDDEAHTPVVPPAPAVVDAPRVRAPRKNEIKVPAPQAAPPVKPSTLVDVSDSDALALVAAETDVTVLRAWFDADSRELVKNAANARAGVLLSK